MTTEQMLSVCAILRAYATADHLGIEVLIKDAPASSYADVLAFALMLLEYHHGDPVAYLDQMANGVLAMHVQETAQSN